MSNLKDIQQIQSLIAKGKGMGYLTFDEVNKALPVEMNTPEQFEEIIGIFEQLEIAIVDSEKDGKKISATPTETDDDAMDGSLELAEDEESADYSSRSTDPVRMYLREMGAVPLLDRDGEVVIAKKIEMGEQDVLYALVEVPVAVEELINVGEDPAPEPHQAQGRSQDHRRRRSQRRRAQPALPRHPAAGRDQADLQEKAQDLQEAGRLQHP